MLKKPVKGKKAKTISCKSAHPDEKIADAVYRKPDIKGVSLAEVSEKTSYTHVTDADIKGASVRRTQLEMADKNITLSNLFHE